MVTWGLVLGLVYTLHKLFAVIFITFVVSYICRNLVKFTYSPFGDRPYVRKIIVILTFLLLLMGFYMGGRFLVPNIVEQGKQVVNTVRDLRIHRDLENVVPNLLASLRFMVYKNSDEYEEEFTAFKEQEDPVKLHYSVFLQKSGKVLLDFKKRLISELGQERYDAAVDTDTFQNEYLIWFIARIEEEYNQDKERLEKEKELELRKDFSDAEFDAFYKQGIETEEEWSRFLKNRILEDRKKQIISDGALKQQFASLFQDQFIKREGEKALLELEGTVEWEERFEVFYNDMKELDGLKYDYDQFLLLKTAKNQKEYTEILDTEEDLEADDIASAFENMKKDAYLEDFKDSSVLEKLNEKVNEGFLPEVVDWATTTIEYTVTLVFQLILSIFLSFFIVWDIPRLKLLIGRLETSRIGKFYREVAPGLVSFGWLMGRAFQAQAIIAVVNTALTLSAMTILDIPHRTFLCSIVFICSFIPVVGVIISSIPLVVVSIQMPNGVIVALEVIGCVLLIHFIETTLLNPKIMGDMLKLHPLLVLVILLVGEYFFGVWGLLLGVPVAVYIFRFVILKDKRAPSPDKFGVLKPAEEESGGKA